MNHIDKIKTLPVPSSKKLIILPWAGEFGGFIMLHMRRVHLLEADEKIVCCKPGQEIFFPSATEFYYDYDLGGWESDDWKHGISKGAWSHLEEIGKSMAEKHPRFSEFEVVLPYREWHCYGDFDEGVYTFFDLKPKEIDTDVDIVIGGRNRAVSSHRNYSEWSRVVPVLQEAGYKVGAVGAPDSSFDMDFVDERAWDWDDFDNATVAMMQKAKLVVTTGCGIAPLGIFLRKPMVMIDLAFAQGVPCLEAQRDPSVYFCRLDPELIAVFAKYRTYKYWPDTRTDHHDDLYPLLQTILCYMKKGLPISNPLPLSPSTCPQPP